MFAKGDYIIYGSSGVCEVRDICVPDFVKEKERLYYKLAHYFSTEIIYTPVDTTVFMRPVISKKEAENLINIIPEIKISEFKERNTKELSDHYAATIKSHDCKDLICLIKTVYNYNQIAIENGKNLRQTDQRFMKQAEEYLYGELSVALDIPKDGVKDYIERAIQLKERIVIRGQ